MNYTEKTEAILLKYGLYNDKMCDELADSITQAVAEERERVVEIIRELDKYDYIPVQVKEENPSAWAIYTEGRDKIFKDLLSSLDKEIINPKE